MINLPFGLIVDPENKEVIEKLHALETYNFDLITRSVQEKYDWTADKSRHIEIETKKFFALAFLDQGHYHIPEPDNDIVYSLLYIFL